MNLHYNRGEAIFSAGPPSVTDEDGRFISKQREPGNYVAQVGPQSSGKEDRVMTQFTDHDLQKVDTDYANAILARRSESRFREPRSVAARRLRQRGTIRAKKTSFYRVHISIPQDKCALDEKLLLDLTHDPAVCQFNRRSGSLWRRFPAAQPPGAAATCWIFSTGRKQSVANASRCPSKSQTQSEIKVPLTVGPDISGRIMIAEGAKGPVPSAMKLLMQTQGNIQFVDERQPVTPDPEGNFRFPEAPLARERLTVTGLGARLLRQRNPLQRHRANRQHLHHRRQPHPASRFWKSCSTINPQPSPGAVYRVRINQQANRTLCFTSDGPSRLENIFPRNQANNRRRQRTISLRRTRRQRIPNPRSSAAKTVPEPRRTRSLVPNALLSRRSKHRHAEQRKPHRLN